MNPYESPAWEDGRFLHGKSLPSGFAVVGAAFVCFLLSAGVGIAVSFSLVWVENVPSNAWFACYQRYGMPSLVYGGVSAFLLPMLVKRQINAMFLAVSLLFVGFTCPSLSFDGTPRRSDVMILYAIASYAITILASRSVRCPVALPALDRVQQ